MKPTVGRIVHFHPVETVTHAAIIAYVESDTCVNLSVFDGNGRSYGQTSVQLVAPGAPKPEFGAYCEWIRPEVDRTTINISTLKVSQETVDALARIVKTVDMKIQEVC